MLVYYIMRAAVLLCITMALTLVSEVIATIERANVTLWNFMDVIDMEPFYQRLDKVPSLSFAHIYSTLMIVSSLLSLIFLVGQPSVWRLRESDMQVGSDVQVDEDVGDIHNDTPGNMDAPNTDDSMNDSPANIEAYNLTSPRPRARFTVAADGLISEIPPIERVD